jgi:hypothetical protein
MQVLTSYGQSLPKGDDDIFRGFRKNPHDFKYFKKKAKVN